MENLEFSQSDVAFNVTLKTEKQSASAACCVHCPTETQEPPQTSVFPRQTERSLGVSSALNDDAFTVGGAGSRRHCLNPAHTERGIVGDDEWSPSALRDFKTFSQRVRTNQWERSFLCRTAGRSRPDDDDKNTRIDRDWPEKHDISRILFPPCFALLSLESTNHRTILITCCHRRG